MMDTTSRLMKTLGAKRGLLALAAAAPLMNGCAPRQQTATVPDSTVPYSRETIYFEQTGTKDDCYKTGIDLALRGGGSVITCDLRDGQQFLMKFDRLGSRMPLKLGAT